jgi:lambda family phage portal protein
MDSDAGGQDAAMRAYQGQWSRASRLQSSDIEAYRSKDHLLSGARDVSRTSPYGRSAVRTLVDNVVGSNFALSMDPDLTLLGVTSEQAEEWADLVEAEWRAYAEGLGFSADAQRRQSFSGLMRTAFAGYFVGGEALGSVEWKAGFGSAYSTCLYLMDPERLSDPHGAIDYNSKRRMGVERDKHGAPIAYWIRQASPSDGLWQPAATYKWDRKARFSSWGRPRILHAFEADRPDMSRGLSHFTTAIDPIRSLDEYQQTELEAAAVRATFAATITSELNYEQAIGLLGPDQRQALQANGPLSMALQMMTERLGFYGSQDIKVGKTKITHLLPNEKLDIKNGTLMPGVLKEYDEVSLYKIASALGVDYASLTKNYSSTNYSGARVALAEIARSYSVRRADFTSQLCIPFAMAWLEEAIVVRETIPMLGKSSFYEKRGALRMDFDTLGKPLIDPLKEMQAKQTQYQMGATSLRQICKEFDMDYRQVLEQRAREKADMALLGLKPEDINPDLIAQGAGRPPSSSAESK